MSEVAPAFAAVRPRVSRRGEFERRLLEEVVAERADETPHGSLRIEGTWGSGKSTAMRHLAAVFADDERFEFLDEPNAAELAARRPDRFLVAAFATASPDDPKLEPWGMDEFVEYLLARHHAECGSVMARLGNAARRAWQPQLATIVLDRFAADVAASDATTELHRFMQQRLTQPDQRTAAGRYCLALIMGDFDKMKNAKEFLDSAGCPNDIAVLLRFPIVQMPLAAKSLFDSICRGSKKSLRPDLPFELVEAVGQLCRGNADAIAALNAILSSSNKDDIHAMTASILFAADAKWTPKQRENSVWWLGGGFFREANWPNVNLAKANLSKTDFSGGNFEEACFSEARAHGALFDGANLRGAMLDRLEAGTASFSGANLVDARLPNANLTGADFTEADLTGASLFKANLMDADLTSARLAGALLMSAQLNGAVLDGSDFTNAVLSDACFSSADLRTACLNGAIFEKANLKHAQLEDVVWPKAQLKAAVLSGAHLSGSTMPFADLREANLSGAYLAEINWQGADLRGANLSGATFHMGSSRSGLVGSPIACEGSKTGFYTDDFEDRHFKRPETIRKANLHRADLRGANLAKLDLYLVDLREAKLDRSQIDHARKCGAILEDVVT